ncbi:hypothetical protein ACKKBF_B15375 [Auxenochlorella protothecoides x Auxenochlorella symbiontica]
MLCNQDQKQGPDLAALGSSDMDVGVLVPALQVTPADPLAGKDAEVLRAVDALVQSALATNANIISTADSRGLSNCQRSVATLSSELQLGVVAAHACRAEGLRHTQATSTLATPGELSEAACSAALHWDTGLGRADAVLSAAQEGLESLETGFQSLLESQAGECADFARHLKQQGADVRSQLDGLLARLMEAYGHAHDAQLQELAEASQRTEECARKLQKEQLELCSAARKQGMDELKALHAQHLVRRQATSKWLLRELVAAQQEYAGLMPSFEARRVEDALELQRFEEETRSMLEELPGRRQVNAELGTTVHWAKMMSSGEQRKLMMEDARLKRKCLAHQVSIARQESILQKLPSILTSQARKLASMRLEELQGLIAQGRACTVELQDSGLLAGNLCWDEAETAVCGILHSDTSLGLS